MLDLPEKIIIFDTEYTAWAGSAEYNWSRPNEYREIVQIGAILVDTKQLSEIDNINLFVKPVKNPILSEYFTNLTGIKQKDIDENGIYFKEATLKFFSWCGSYPIYSYGGDEENCLKITVFRLIGIKAVILLRHSGKKQLLGIIML